MKIGKDNITMRMGALTSEVTLSMLNHHLAASADVANAQIICSITPLRSKCKFKNRGECVKLGRNIPIIYVNITPIVVAIK